ncbi:MAG: hypothetical protein H2060_07705 [Azoarcus sp.]|nr:hypothetical protein [Azoarcus sp.]
MRNRQVSPTTIWIWVALSTLIGTATVWILDHGYASEQALFRWSQITMALDASELHLESIGLVYPHAPLYLLAPFYYLPGLATPFAPYLASVLTGGALLTLWYHHLRLRSFPLFTATAMVLLVAMHPVFLWAATGGTEKTLSLLVFYLMCVACVRLLRVGDVRSIIMLGAVLALYFFVDERTAFLFMALLPMLPFLAPMRMLRASMLSTFLLISLPSVIAVLSWVYLNWLFHGDPLHFLTSPESAFIGARQSIHETPWLKAYGGEFFEALGATTLMALLTIPAFGWVLYRLRARRRMLVGMIILGLHPVLAAALATKSYFVEHPLDFVFLALAAFMSAMLLIPKAWSRKPLAPICWLLVSWFGGWMALDVMPTRDMSSWRNAASGIEQRISGQAESRVGRWLDRNRLTTLIDNRSGYQVIAARGDSDDLWLPFMHEFKLAERMRLAGAEQVVVIDPSHPRATRDRITSRYPSLYGGGQPGYALVLDEPPWRVYRRTDIDWPSSEARP